MIKFFRKIRRKLLSENKFSKYLIYATGEIVLVVIGILIAVQINTWNQNRISKKVEKVILNRLILDLNQDHQRYEELDSIYSVMYKNNKDFSQLIRKSTLNDDDYNAIINFWGANPHEMSCRTSTYEEMVNTGKIYLISNVELVTQIIDYYKLLSQFQTKISKEGNQYGHVWNGPELINFWHMKNKADDKQKIMDLADLLLDQDGEPIKHLYNIVGWGTSLTRRNINRINILDSLNINLSKEVNFYLQQNN